MAVDPLGVALDVTPLAGNRSGVGWFVAEILDAMEGRDDVTLVPWSLSLRARARAVGAAASRTLRDGGLPPGTRHLPLPAHAVIAAWGHLDTPGVERWLDGVDVIHGTNFVVPPTREVAAVVTVHDCAFERYPELCSPAVRRLVPALRRAVTRGAWVHTPTEFVADEARHILRTDRVVTVAHGVPRLAFGAVPTGGLVGDSPFVLAMGTLEPRKNIARLVEAFGLLAGDHPGVQLLVAGADGPGRPAVDAARSALPPAVARRVRLVGYVDDRTRATLLARARVFAFPSLYEGFGFPVLEAMAAGTPVVAGRSGAVAEVAGDGALLVEPTDVNALAGAITRLLDDPGLAARMTSAGRRRAAGYSWRTAAKGLVDLYRAAAGQS